MSQRLPVNLKRKIATIYDLFTYAIAFVLLTGILWVTLPPQWAPIGSIAGILIFFLIYDSLRSNSPRNAEALQTNRPGAEKLGWILWVCNMTWPVACFFLARKVYGGRGSGGQKIITLLREEAILVGLWLIPAFTVGLLLLLMWAWWKKVRQKQQIAIALALTLVAYPVGAMLFGIAEFATAGRQWNMRQKIRAKDNRTYYLLHSPPPFNGPSSNVIARQIKHSPISVTVQIITPDFGSDNLASVLSTGSEDKAPKVRALCKMLLQSKKGWGKEKY